MVPKGIARREVRSDQKGIEREMETLRGCLLLFKGGGCEEAYL
jgi:hypothetical protein